MKYYAFNYNITYKNYVFSGGIPLRVNDGLDRSDSSYAYKGMTHYILIKKPSDYILKGNSGTCTTIGTDEYCYIEDDTNYYPELLNNSLYWSELSDDAYYIKNNKVGVYKTEYKVIDYSGNVSDTLIKTIYCHDRTTPVLKDVGTENTIDITSLYGYHQKITIGFENEREAMFYSYSCKNGGTTCSLPSNIFELMESDATRKVDKYTIDVTKYKQLGQIIKDMQNKGLEVDIQYRANCLNGGVCYHSALITGRKPIEILATTTGEEHE